MDFSQGVVKFRKQYGDRRLKYCSDACNRIIFGRYSYLTIHILLLLTLRQILLPEVIMTLPQIIVFSIGKASYFAITKIEF